MLSVRNYMILIVLLFASVSANAQSSCDRLLDHGITNITRHLSSQHAIAYKWYENCGIDFNSASDSRIRKANLEVFGYGSGGGSSNVSELRTKLLSWCQTNEQFAQSNSNLFEEAKTISGPALQTFAQCVDMVRKDIKIDIIPLEENARFLKVEIDSTHDGDLRFLGLEMVNYTCTIRMVRDGAEVAVDDQPFIRNSNIHADCTRTPPTITELDGIGRIEYDAAYLSVNTSGPALPISFPRVVEDYRVTPPNSVLAFNSETCPAGWDVFTPAQGRLVVGTGNNNGANTDEVGRTLATRNLGDTGGEEVHQLTVAEMPAHTHDHNRAKRVSRRNGDHGAAEFHGGIRDTTSSAGGNQAHNNMPPYIALMYCEKR